MKELVKHEDVHIQRAIQREMPEEDITMLREAFKHLYVSEAKSWNLTDIAGPVVE